jgi:hypothetical protein
MSRGAALQLDLGERAQVAVTFDPANPEHLDRGGHGAAL